MKKIVLAVVAGFALLGSVSLAQAAEPTAAQVDAIVQKLTLDEKLTLLGGDQMMIRPVAGLPSIKMSDGPVGVRTWGAADGYPAGVALAATWDPAMAEREGASLAKDAHARGVNVLLAPGVNIYRQPMNGRNFEYLGEDPFLSGRMAVGYIKGLQGGGVSATVKHFAGNNSEFDRHNTNSVIDERTLHEIYLPAFEAAVKDGHVDALMDSYNLVNGDHSTESKTLNIDILRKEWGFKGLVMSDWVATYDGVKAANSGLDLEMPRAKAMTAGVLKAALTAGTVTQATIDEKVRRIVWFSLKYGTPAGTTVAPGPTNRADARKVAYAAISEGIVLLKNEGGVLPLDLQKVKRVAVIGPAVMPLMTGGGGSSHVTTVAATDLYSAMVARSGGAEILYSQGTMSEADIFSKTKFDGSLKQEMYGEKGFVGEPEISKVGHVGMWTPLHDIGQSTPAAMHSYRWSGSYTAGAAGNYLFLLGGRRSDDYKLAIDGKVILEHNQTEGVAPMTMHMTLSAGQKIAFKLEYVQRQRDLGAGLGIVAASDVVLPEARQMAASADVVVVEVGYGVSYESEGFDRTWQLPIGQDALVEAMAAANKKTVVVLNSGGGSDIRSWVDMAPGLVHSFYGGEEGGDALADILIGAVNPSGKLPMSFERDLKDTAAFETYYQKPGTKDVAYKEGVFLGYRAFDRNTVKPLFPFGFGLSYTTFAVEKLKVKDDGGGNVLVSFEVRNTGKVKGDDVAQVYVGELQAAVPRPVKELKGFERVALEPGQTKHVDVTLNARAFSYWDVLTHGWKRDDGASFTIYAGDSSVNLPLTQAIALKP